MNKLSTNYSRYSSRYGGNPSVVLARVTDVHPDLQRTLRSRTEIPILSLLHCASQFNRLGMLAFDVTDAKLPARRPRKEPQLGSCRSQSFCMGPAVLQTLEVIHTGMTERNGSGMVIDR